MAVKQEFFGNIEDVGNIDLITLENSNNLKAEIITLGATLRALYVPDSNNQLDDVILGYDKLDDYLSGQRYYGATIGRYANRIGQARFQLNDKIIKLSLNDEANRCHCHGGLKGFSRVNWLPVSFERTNGSGVTLFYFSKDGEEGYPGNLDVWVTYFLSDNNELKVDFRAKCDTETIINMTHHSYFNLAGHNKGQILNHEVCIDADAFTPVNDNLIPTGKLESVKDGPMDFRKSKKIGKHIEDVDGGYNHNYVLNNYNGKIRKVGYIKDPSSSRKMEVSTTQPGVQFNSGNLINSNDLCKKNSRYPTYGGFTFQAQNFPDAPNKKNFPNAVISAGTNYHHSTVFKFSIDKS